MDKINKMSHKRVVSKERLEFYIFHKIQSLVDYPKSMEKYLRKDLYKAGGFWVTSGSH